MGVRGNPGYTKARVGCPRRPQRGGRLGLSGSPASQPQITPESIHGATHRHSEDQCFLTMAKHRKSCFFGALIQAASQPACTHTLSPLSPPCQSLCNALHPSSKMSCMVATPRAPTCWAVAPQSRTRVLPPLPPPPPPIPCKTGHPLTAPITGKGARDLAAVGGRAGQGSPDALIQARYVPVQRGTRGARPARHM